MDQDLIFLEKWVDFTKNNLELQWPLWGTYILEKINLRGVPLKRENPESLKKNGIHSLVCRDFPKTEWLSNSFFKGFFTSQMQNLRWKPQLRVNTWPTLQLIPPCLTLLILTVHLISYPFPANLLSSWWVRPSHEPGVPRIAEFKYLSWAKLWAIIKDFPKEGSK